jgi:hypothetical protein
MSSFRNLPSRNRIHILSVGSLDHGNLVYDALIGRSDFRLSIATDYPELWAMPKQEVIDVAILHDSLSLIGLDDACRFIRRHWPLARILVLRNGQDFLEDALFDSCMEPNTDPIMLLAVIEQLEGERRYRRFGNGQQ